MGAQFHPFYSTTVRNGSCVWQEGGKFLPNTTDDFGRLLGRVPGTSRPVPLAQPASW